MTSLTIVLNNGYARREATRAIAVAHEGMVVEVREPRRTLDQNARLHAMLGDIVKSGYEHLGELKFNIQDWKTLFVSAWMMETGRSSAIVNGINGEAVQMYWHTSSMNKEQLGEVMTIVERFCAEKGIKLRDDPQ